MKLLTQGGQQNDGIWYFPQRTFSGKHVSWMYLSHTRHLLHCSSSAVFLHNIHRTGETKMSFKTISTVKTSFFSTFVVALSLLDFLVPSTVFFNALPFSFDLLIKKILTTSKY